jgi:hypothetical protein
MSFAHNYLKNHTFLPLLFEEPPSGLLNYVVVIPAYRERNIPETLMSLNQCIPPEKHLEIIVIINSGVSESDEVKKENLEILNTVNHWIAQNQPGNKKFFVFNCPDLPQKHAGAGLARKIGMDAAISRFNMINNPEGIILSMDGDCTVEPDYFIEAEKACKTNPDLSGIIFPFAHPTEGSEYDEDIYRAITQYELYLRYFKLMLDYTGYPYGGYTIGSCFGIKAKMYASNGGMNRKKGGEDFYFLQKLFPLGNFIQLKSAKVIPSPRISDRVPFGTGPSVRKLIDEHTDMKVYHPKGFEHLHHLFNRMNDLYEGKTNIVLKQISPFLSSFLKHISFYESVTQIRNNTSSKPNFTKRFYRYFNAFQAIKYLNYISENDLPKMTIHQAIEYLAALTGVSYNPDLKLMLTRIRKYEYGR